MAFASIRKYKSSDAAETGRRAGDENSGFAPIARATEGIEAWYLIDSGNGTLVTVTICANEAAANDSVEKAREWVGANAADLVEGSPEITSGEVHAQS